jgi:hypothetical protein
VKEIEKYEESLDTVKLKELLKIMEATQIFLKKLKINDNSDIILKKFIQIFKPYKNLNFFEISNILKKDIYKKQLKVQKIEEKIKDIDFEKLQNPDIRNSLTKKELSIVAERELGISRWKLYKLKREEMDEEIINAFENYQTLKTIAKRASEKEQFSRALETAGP